MTNERAETKEQLQRLLRNMESCHAAPTVKEAIRLALEDMERVEELEAERDTLKRRIHEIAEINDRLLLKSAGYSSPVGRSMLR